MNSFIMFFPQLYFPLGVRIRNFFISFNRWLYLTFRHVLVNKNYLIVVLFLFWRLVWFALWRFYYTVCCLGVRVIELILAVIHAWVIGVGVGVCGCIWGRCLGLGASTLIIVIIRQCWAIIGSSNRIRIRSRPTTPSISISIKITRILLTRARARFRRYMRTRQIIIHIHHFSFLFLSGLIPRLKVFLIGIGILSGHHIIIVVRSRTYHIYIYLILCVESLHFGKSFFCCWQVAIRLHTGCAHTCDLFLLLFVTLQIFYYFLAVHFIVAIIIPLLCHMLQSLIILFFLLLLRKLEQKVLPFPFHLPRNIITINRTIPFMLLLHTFEPEAQILAG